MTVTQPAGPAPVPGGATRRGPRRSVLFFAFAFAVIADPASSVAYAIDAALRALHGDLALLLPTMVLVVALVVVVTADYRQLVSRFPKDGGAATGAGRAFGPRWTFIPVGALVVDFVLTIGISVAAAASAVIALFPGLGTLRIPLAPALLLVAAAGSSFQAGPGLLKAPARTADRPGVPPSVLGRANRHHTPFWSVVVYLAMAAVIIVASAGEEQELVLCYAVAVFVSFLVGLPAMTRFARSEGRAALARVNGLAAVAVAFTMVVYLFRGWPVLSLAGTLAIGGCCYLRRVRAGRPSGIENVEATG